MTHVLEARMNYLWNAIRVNIPCYRNLRD